MPDEKPAKKTSVANDESKRWRKGRPADHVVEERANACYAYILEGGTKRQICQRLVDRFGVSLRTSFDDYGRAMTLLREEQSETRGDILNQLQALRLAVAKKAIQKGQLQAATILLQQIGMANGEGTEFTASEEVKLNISIEPQQNQGET
jgi:hypothetical protein